MNSKQAFIEWVKNNDPFIYNLAVGRYKAKQSGLSGTADFFSSLTDTIKNVVPAVMNYRQQNKIMDVQIQRAKQGLPPLETSQYAPVIKVETAITPESEAAAKRIGVDLVKQGVGDMKPIFFGGLALMAFLFYKNRR